MSEFKQPIDIDEKNFLIKRAFVQSITRISAISLILAALLALVLLFWLKPELINTSYLLELIKNEKIDFLQLAEIAVTGTSVMVTVFVLIIVIAYMMLTNSKNEKIYQNIINKLSKEDK